MEAYCNLLYRETLGAGDDTESAIANGLEVTLTEWVCNDWRVGTHYLLTAKVMIERQFVVNECETFRGFRSSNEIAELIRKAINRVDQLKELNPELNAGS